MELREEEGGKYLSEIIFVSFFGFFPASKGTKLSDQSGNYRNMKCPRWMMAMVMASASRAFSLFRSRCEKLLVFSYTTKRFSDFHRIP